MNNINDELTRILDDIFIGKNVELKTFLSRWDAVLASRNSNVSSSEMDGLVYIKEETADAITHMPGKGFLSSEVDWKKWSSDSDALKLQFYKVALKFKLSRATLQLAFKGLSGVTGIRPPYLNNGDLQNQIEVYLRDNYS